MQHVIVPMEQWHHLEHSIQLARSCLPPEQVNAEKLRAEITHPDAQYYVALIHGGVKAFAGWKRTGINSSVYELPWCVVHPEYRRQGIGRALTEQRLADIKYSGGKIVLLSTPSPQVYETYGFKVIAGIPGQWASCLMLKEIRDTNATNS